MKRRMRFVVAVALIAAVAFPVAASGTAERPATPAPTPQGPASIQFIASAGGSGRSFEGGMNRFNEAYGDRIRVNVDTIALASLLDQLMTQFVAREAFYDVLAVNSVWQGRIQAYLEPLNPYIREMGPDVTELYGAQMDAVTYNGNIIGLPIRVGTDVLYYRSDLLQAAGLNPPKTLDELVATARALTTGPRDNRQTFGFAFMAQDPFFTTSTTADFLFPHGIYFLDEPMEGPNPGLRSEAATRVFATIYQLWEERLMPSPLEWTYDDNLVALQQGRLAMTFDDYMRAPILEREGSQVAGRMAYSTLPSQPIGPETPRTRGGWWILSIDRNSRNKSAAYEFIKFMTGYETQEYMALEWSNGPSVVALIRDPAFGQVNKAAEAAYVNLNEIGIRDPAAIAQREQIARAIHTEMHNLFLGRKRPNEIGPAIYAAIEQIMR